MFMYSTHKKRKGYCSAHIVIPAIVTRQRKGIIHGELSEEDRFLVDDYLSQHPIEPSTHGTDDHWFPRRSIYSKANRGSQDYGRKHSLRVISKYDSLVFVFDTDAVPRLGFKCSSCRVRFKRVYAFEAVLIMDDDSTTPYTKVKTIFYEEHQIERLLADDVLTILGANYVN